MTQKERLVIKTHEQQQHASKNGDTIAPDCSVYWIQVLSKSSKKGNKLYYN